MNTKESTKSKIISVLGNDDRLWNKEKTELNQTLLFDLLDKIDEKIIDLLLQEKSLREKFFVKIRDVYVFKTNEFKFYMEENKIDNSYTQYKNRIGLTDGKRFLKDTNDVVLDFPYKDCVLEGGQSTEEGTDTYFEYSEKEKKYEEKQAKRKEIFYNQILAHDEIDRLFDPKAFVIWKRYTKDGEQSLCHSREGGNLTFNRDENGTIKENLIIKGNNLLALHSLKKQYAGKIKLIYIDPPYNTGNDGFKYNDRFNHSSWLTFMKNRLEKAKELLKNDGLIFVSIDDNEQAYLKILMDDIFGEINFITNFVWKRRSSSAMTQNMCSVDHEYIICYQKSSEFRFIGLKKNFESYSNPDNDPKGDWVLGDLTVGMTSTQRPNQFYELIDPGTGNIFLPNPNRVWAYIPVSMEKLINEGRVYFPEDISHKPMLKRYKSDLKDSHNPVSSWIEGKSSSKVGLKSGLNTEATKELQKIFGKKIFDYPKPTSLLYALIKSSTKNNDIVLDFNAGSGTTAHALLALNKEDGGNRKFILVEQMDYINSVTVPRIQKVMEKENIEDSFIYFELAKWNEKAKEEILACNNLKELEKLFDTLYEKYFLNYNLKIKEFKEKVSKEENFRNLSLEEQKKIFLAMLDLNQMYVNKTEMADKKYGISKEDQKLTEEFYKE